ncbi:MAG: CRISPR-associated protein Cas4 [Thermodesulfobacteriota bacterium]
MAFASQYTEDDLLPLSALSDVVFCERRAGLHLLERLWEDNVHTAEGTISHERVHGLVGTEVRGSVRIVRGLLIRSLQLGLSGKADMVEFHRAEEPSGQPFHQQRSFSGVRLPATKGLWSPYPVEYKSGILRSNRSFEVQLCAQAMCLEEMLRVQVPRGAIYFGKTGRRLELLLDERLRSETRAAAFRLHEIAASGTTPRVKHEKKCAKCSLLDSCMPQIVGRGRKVSLYIRRMVDSKGTEP